MRPVESTFEIEVGTTPTANVGPRTAVGIRPSDLDPEDEMRVDVGGTIIYRAFDPVMP